MPIGGHTSTRRTTAGGRARNNGHNHSHSSYGGRVRGAESSATGLLDADRDRTGSSHTAFTGAGTSAALPTFMNLWDAVTADVAEEAAAGPRSPYSAATQDEGEVTARVMRKRRQCVATLSKATGRLKIVQLPKDARGKEKVILNVPLRAVINMETPEERDFRQRVHAANDCTTRMNHNKCGYPAEKYLCSFAEVDGDSNVYPHSRVNTVASSTLSASHGRGVSFGPGGLPAVRPLVTGTLHPLPNHYSIHYTKVGGNGGKRSVHSLEISVDDGDAEKLEEAFVLAKAVLRRVYLSGPKHLIAFVSPKSGTGQGEEVFNQQVKPILHFSRHTVQVLRTKRAHDAEDYVADLDHGLNDDHVLVAVGGDGMVHEVINGLHRRRLQLMGIIREECRKRTLGPQQQQQQQPAVTNGQAGGGENEEESPLGLAGTLDKKRLRQEMDHGPASSTATSGDMQTGAGAAAAAAGDEEVASAGATGSAMTARSSTQRSVLRLDPMRSDDGSLPSHQSSQFFPALSPAAHSRTLSGAAAAVTAGGAGHDPDFAAHVTDCFLARGWEGLLPMTATVPTGSACGLAKSLDVLAVAQAAVALVHLSTCPEDLMYMRFDPNDELVDYHTRRLSTRKRRNAEQRFMEYQRKNQREIAERETLLEMQNSVTSAMAVSVSSAGDSATQGPVSTPLEPPGAVASPFLKDGSAVYPNSVNMAIGAPEMSSRIAFMSLSFGIANDIDRGSEHLRWMGNARFAVYGGYQIIKGITTYKATIRYLPWESNSGMKLEKLHPNDKVPDPSQLPRCTMTADCPHCLEHTSVNRLVAASRRRREKLGRGADEEDVTVARSNTRDAHAAADIAAASRRGLREYCAPAELALDPAVVAAASDADLMGEDAVDFDDRELPWVTIRGEIYNLLMCNLRDVGQDMMMAPLAHMCDGAMDLVFCRVDDRTRKGGRKEFIQFFSGLETGEHVNQWFTNYVKARAVEVKVDEGISMSDGEMMPLSSVRLTKVRSGNRLVRLGL